MGFITSMTEFGPEGELASQAFAADLRTLMSYYSGDVVSYDNGDKSLTLTSRFEELEIPDTLPMEAVITESQRNSLPSLKFTIKGNNKSWVIQFAQVSRSKPSYLITNTEIGNSGAAWLEERIANSRGSFPASPTELSAMLPQLHILRPMKQPATNETEEQPLKQNKFVAWLGRLVRKNDK